MKRSVRTSRAARRRLSISEDGSSDGEVDFDAKVPVISVPDSPPSKSSSPAPNGNSHSLKTPTQTVATTPRAVKRTMRAATPMLLPESALSSSKSNTPYAMRSREKTTVKVPPFIAVSRLEVDALLHEQRAQSKLETLMRHKHIIDLQRTLDSDDSIDASAAALPDSQWGADFDGTSSNDSTPEKNTSSKSAKGQNDKKPNVHVKSEKDSSFGKAEVADEDQSAFGLVQAPVFYPTAAEFADPATFLDRIHPLVEPHGICRIVPPKEWNRDVWRSQINPSTFSFNTKSQSVHTLQRRNGAYAQFMVKLQHFWTNVSRFPIEKLPEIDGTPVDLYALHCAVKEAGGHEALKNKWHTLLPILHINPDASYGAANLTQIYRKLVLPFEQHSARNPHLPRYLSTYPEPTPIESKEDLKPRTNGRAKRSLHQTKSASNGRPNPSYSIKEECEDDSLATRRGKRVKYEEVKVEANIHSTADDLHGPVSDSVLRALMSIGDADLDAAFGAYGKLDEEVSAAEAGRWRSVRAMSFVPEQDAAFVLCFYCRKGDKPQTLVLCDSPGCSGGAHLRCMDPPMTRPPHGKYYCPSCRGEKHPSDTSSSTSQTPEERPAFHVVDATGREISGLDLSANLGFGHAPGKRYTLAEYKEMATKFATYWFGRNLDSTNSVAEPTTPSPVRSKRASTSLRNFSKDSTPTMVTSATEIEAEYWKLVSSADRLVRVAYGSDVDVSFPGACSGFPLDVQGKTVGKDCPEVRRWENVHHSDTGKQNSVPRSEIGYLRENGWNLNSLPYVTLLKWLGESISGVTRPMLYIGMLFSSFCWHTEDNWLYSINYLHTGAPKRWYGVSGHEAERFESALRAELPHIFAAEPQILFQLTTVLHPDILKRHGVNLCTTLQKEGEFVITFPRAYHSGFNCGFNVAESVNFATWRWLDWGLTAANQYRFVRSTVFAHEKFIWQTALSSSHIVHLPLLISIYRHLVLYMKFARAAIQALKQQGITALYHSSRLHYEPGTDPNTGESVIVQKKTPKTKALNDPAYVNLLDDVFEPEDPQCYVCGYDLYMHRVDCQCRSPRIPRCLKHGGHVICECTNSRKFVSYRFTPSSVRHVLVNLETRLTKLGAHPPSVVKLGKKSKK